MKAHIWIIILISFFESKASMNIIGIIPAAGFGTRFLPFTKIIPKELVPLAGTPALEYILRECLHNHINSVAIVTNSHKQGLQAYCKKTPVVDAFLQSHNKESLLDAHYNTLSQLNISFVMQEEAKGLGHAIGVTNDIALNHELIAVLLPDDIMSNNECIGNMIAYAQTHKASVIAVQQVPHEKTSAYGIVGLGKQIDTHAWNATMIVEKPNPANAPSNYAVIGRYVFQPEIFAMLEQINPGKNGEYQLTDAIELLIKNGYPVIAYVYDGIRFDVGNPEGFMIANTFFTENAE